jgi:hypothetical protein
MRTYKILFVVIIISLSLKGVAQSSPHNEGQIVIGKVDNLYSEILQEQREIWIYDPKYLDRTKQYPVLYVLD